MQGINFRAVPGRSRSRRALGVKNTARFLKGEMMAKKKEKALPSEIYSDCKSPVFHGEGSLLATARYSRRPTLVGRYVLVETMMVSEGDPIVTDRKLVGDENRRVTRRV